MPTIGNTAALMAGGAIDGTSASRSWLSLISPIRPRPVGPDPSLNPIRDPRYYCKWPAQQRPTCPYVKLTGRRVSLAINDAEHTRNYPLARARYATFSSPANSKTVRALNRVRSEIVPSFKASNRSTARASGICRLSQGSAYARRVDLGIWPQKGACCGAKNLAPARA